MKSLGVFPPVKNPTASLDLLNLYMVNQISSKKKTPETMKRPTHVNMNRDLKIPLRKHVLELPMSPHCVPSKLCIDDMGTNVPYQRLCSTERTDPSQSSQDMNSYRMFKKPENYSCIPLSLAVELPSNKHIPNQNSSPRTASNPWKFASEIKQNEQFSNGDFSDSLFYKLNKHQDIFSSSQKTAEFVQSPATGAFFTKRSVIMGEDCGSLCERRQPDFAMEKTAVQQIWRRDGKAFSNYLEHVIQPTPRHPSSNHNLDSFVSSNMINLLSRDQPGRMAVFHKRSSGSLSDSCVASSDESHYTGGFINGDLTVPQAAFHSSLLNTSYLGTCQSKKPYQKEYSNSEIHEFRSSFEKDCHLTSCERKGKIESNDQENAVQRNTWEYPVCSMGDTPLKELHHKQSCDFDRNEIPIERRGVCPLKGRPMSAERVYLESSQSSQSASYSPRVTESTFSSSSDLISEDEDQIQQQTEDSNKKDTETADNFCQEKMVDHLGDIIVEDNVKIHNFHQSSVKNNIDRFPESQCNAEHTSQNKISDNCLLQARGCDVGVQTEKELAMRETADVAIQCAIISQCSCKSNASVPVKEVPSLHKAGSCSDDSRADTTGGQETDSSF
ncbi:Uncharacterized protein C12orf40 [Lemmus lemmus]